MTTRYDNFLSEVMPYVHDCPEFVAINAIRNACIEFCDKSMYWVYDVDPISGVALQNSYDLSLPDSTTLARIIDGWYDNLQLIPKSEDDLKRIYPMDWRTITGRPQYMTLEDPATVILCPAPYISEANALNLIVALRPTRDSVDIDDNIYQRWAEHIAFGARARLYGTPGQPYYDPQTGANMRALFESAIGEAKIERNRALGRNIAKVRPPRLV